ncbi:hypothetical protein BCR35DRAFT_337335 [Leucosporidium creatinivorum]|uniref:Zn(2)-C6 fungal-type domain-containing protein n=1 Tax=Leucosporidium creatinivorum TaxID=106004 RepID=A0A1Y2FWI3_9BASI|nr:hypothetical protein BCR35DRAFT_337335 [Leucosporidium creatinivorum]
MAPPPDQQAPELLAHSTTSLQQHPYKVYPAPQLPHLLQDSYEISRSAVSWNSEDLTTGSSASEAARWDQQRSASSKMSRASNVCVRCMELKVKCELGGSFSDDQTACQRCRSAQTECVFDFASQQDPRDTFKDEILARMTALEARMHRLEGRIAQIPLPLPGSTTSAPPAVETETASTSLEGRALNTLRSLPSPTPRSSNPEPPPPQRLQHHSISRRILSINLGSIKAIPIPPRAPSTVPPLCHRRRTPRRTTPAARKTIRRCLSCIDLLLRLKGG